VYLHSGVCGLQIIVRVSIHRQIRMDVYYLCTELGVLVYLHSGVCDLGVDVV